MLPEQQQRILGYFIEEAKDHLVTIEQGLLNLQTTLKDSEMVNDLFRAAHSVKGGAAMLGISSILRISHRFEDFFKILKESPNLQVDPQLESLLLQVFDTLRAAVEHLESSTLSDETANALMVVVEPVFTQIDQHLASGDRAETHNDVEQPAPTYIAVFQNDVPQQLRQMLELFKQDRSPASVQQLQEYCHGLLGIGEKFTLPDWSKLCQIVAEAIANPHNTYRTLAPIVIKELKQAQELVATGRAIEIINCEQLLCLLPSPSKATSAPSDDLDDLFTFASEDREVDELFELEANAETLTPGEYLDADSQSEMLALDNLFATEPQTTIQNFPAAEFNFTDLFEDNTANQNGDEEVSFWDNDEDDEVIASTAQSEVNLFTESDSFLPSIAADNSQVEFAYEGLENTAPLIEDEFDDLDKLLEPSVSLSSPTVLQVDTQESSSNVVPSLPSVTDASESTPAASAKRAVFEQMMRVPVKHLDNISNLVGELVVYRNSLEQDQQRLRQFLDNLLSKVQQLSEVGFKMQEL